MTADRKDEIRALVEQKIGKTLEKIAGYESMAQPITPENAIGRISRMDAINNKSVVDAAIRAAKRKLAGLKNVLNTIDDADFGICEKCGGDIPEKRIILMPESKYCVHCARR